MLVTMKEILDRASAENYGVAAPNVDNELNARAAIEAAEKKKAPLILDVGYSLVPDIEFIGLELRALANQSAVPIAINLDHGASLEQVMRAIHSGFTSVMIDRSACSYEENVRDVSEVVKIAHACGVSVEAELGHVGMAAQYDIDRNATLTSPDVAAKYIAETGVDCLAVAIGTAHGAYPKNFVPYLDFDRLVEIKKATNNFPLVLHGSSGTDTEDLRKACTLGINKINVSNDLCQATVKALQNTNFEGNKAYSVFMVARAAFKAKLEELIDVYGSTGKAWTEEKTGIPQTTVAEF